jgi:integrase
VSVYKGQKSPFYRYDFELGGRRFHGSTKVRNRKEAEQIERDLKVKARADLDAERRTGHGPLTLDFAAGRYWQEIGQHHRGHKDTWHKLELLIEFFGPTKRLDQITDADVAALVAWRRSQTAKRLLEASSAGNDIVTIRDHAILSLLIHYGLRRGEVERLRLDDIDWVAETLHITRPKLRRSQCYPLSAPVGEAILRYLREARPRCAQRTVFLTIKAPHRPLSGASISAMVRMRLTKQGLKLDRIGAHCLRHACAGQLMDAGFTLKQIADHLGHRSMSSTRIYTKIDVLGLRQVAELDLGALL